MSFQPTRKSTVKILFPERTKNVICKVDIHEKVRNYDYN